MSHSGPGRIAVAASVAAASALAAPGATVSHAIGGTFQLPVPLWLYLAGAGTAVGASFVVAAAVQRGTVPEAEAPRWPVPASVAGGARWILRVLGLAWWYGAIGVGIAVGDISPLPAVLLWVGIWVGLPIAAVLLGNPWPSLSPFRTTFAGLEWLARRAGARTVDAGLPYPRGLARWPAVALLAGAIWVELVLPGSEVAATVAAFMLAYTLLTLAGMTLVGQVAWLRNAELFEVLLGWFGRIGPVGRRAVRPALCADCGDGCLPDRCVDCPECAVAADDTERMPELRAWAVGLTEVRSAGWSDATFIVLALAGVTYDGLRETAFGAGLLGALLPPVQRILGVTGTTFLLVDTLAFILVVAAFHAAFSLIVTLTRRLVGPSGGPGPAMGSMPGLYAVTLLPIAAGYLIAHYLTLVLQGIVWLPSLLADPLMSLQPQLDWIPVALVWYLSVAAIVGGHVVAIVLAHRLALRYSAGRPVRAGLPMVTLMIAYTVLSLWIIAQPIVVEPGMPAAVR